MTTGLKIKDVADASGFTAATLRYYEQIGLLPGVGADARRLPDVRPAHASIAWRSSPAPSSSAARLEEITGLTTAWDGGQCGPIQDQLRQLVAGQDRRRTAATRRTDDLHQRAAARRDRPRTPPTRRAVRR